MTTLPTLTSIGATLPQVAMAAPQRSGPLTVLPLIETEPEARAYAPPLSSLKLAKVQGYGKVEMENRPGSGVAIVPLHIGYVQDQAQNHALCRAGFVGENQKVLFQDACCVQQAQGGYIEGRDAQQWFFVLPLRLREQALKLRGQVGCGKLWADIATFNQRYKLPQKGHLEHLICRQRAHLTQYGSRFERLEGQRGALFFIGDKLVGLELAPTTQYFAEVWSALVCFCYGAEAMYFEQHQQLPGTARQTLGASDLTGVRAALAQRRQAVQHEVLGQLAPLREAQFTAKEEERYIDLTLSTVESARFAGQTVADRGRLVYASIFARGEQLVN